jgi:hypothetical protein
MDATQKRRMWKVAIVHFALTVFVVWKLLHYSAWSGPIEKEIWFNAWGLFWLKVFVFLQPLLSFLTWFFNLIHVPQGELGGLVEFLEGVAMVASIPVWSLCFGWIYVKLFDRLNHFSTLGKKIF